jgi:hypothetical protein
MPLGCTGAFRYEPRSPLLPLRSIIIFACRVAIDKVHTRELCTYALVGLEDCLVKKAVLLAHRVSRWSFLLIVGRSSDLKMITITRCGGCFCFCGCVFRCYRLGKNESKVKLSDPVPYAGTHAFRFKSFINSSIRTAVLKFSFVVEARQVPCIIQYRFDMHLLTQYKHAAGIVISSIYGGRNLLLSLNIDPSMLVLTSRPMPYKRPFARPCIRNITQTYQKTGPVAFLDQMFCPCISNPDLGRSSHEKSAQPSETNNTQGIERQRAATIHGQAIDRPNDRQNDRTERP